jgi:hypothetical protein
VLARGVADEGSAILAEQGIELEGDPEIIEVHNIIRR